MKSIVSTFNKLASNKYRELGFACGKSCFIRIHNDIIQIFECVPTLQDCTCTVVFGMIPLCMGATVFGSGLYDLCTLNLDYNIRSEGWRYSSCSARSVNKCIELMIKAVDDYLIPLFQNCNDCKTALRELLLIEELVDRRRIELLEKNGDTDCARPWRERSILDPKKYYMSLKAKDQVYAIEFLKIHIELYGSLVKDMQLSETPLQPEIVVKRHIAMRERYIEHLERLMNNDVMFFDELLKRNEQQSLSAIAKQFPRLRVSK